MVRRISEELHFKDVIEVIYLLLQTICLIKWGDQAWSVRLNGRDIDTGFKGLILIIAVCVMIEIWIM
jgi:hypothetical protein